MGHMHAWGIAFRVPVVVGWGQLWATQRWGARGERRSSLAAKGRESHTFGAKRADDDAGGGPAVDAHADADKPKLRPVGMHRSVAGSNHGGRRKARRLQAMVLIGDGDAGRGDVGVANGICDDAASAGESVVGASRFERRRWVLQGQSGGPSSESAVVISSS